MPTKDTKSEKKPEAKDKTPELPKFKGKFVAATGRRKTAVARIRVYKKGKGVVLINDSLSEDYLSEDYDTIVRQPLKLAGMMKDFDISVVAAGGGKKAQAEAVRHAIARALVDMDEKYKPGLKAKGWITRDARRKERKKPGLKKARRAPQWSKR